MANPYFASLMNVYQYQMSAHQQARQQARQQAMKMPRKAATNEHNTRPYKKKKYVNMDGKVRTWNDMKS